MTSRLTVVHALSPLHAGTGQGVGVIDLPIAREKATGIPLLPGSSLKGALRDRCTDKATQTRLFGPETGNADDHAGALHFSDQRLLLLPVRSLKGTFAWVTSPYLLQRLHRDAKAAGVKAALPDTVPMPRVEDGIVSSSSALMLTGKRLVLEDLDLAAKTGEKAQAWADWLKQQLFDDAAWQKRFADRFCIVHDDLLTFLLTTATEVTARIRLEPDTKSVAQGGLWYEESLPTESILSGLVLGTGVTKSGATPDGVLTDLAGLMGTVQLGGKATVGRGLCNVRMLQEG